MTREDFANMLRGFASDGPEPPAEYVEVLEAIATLAKQLPNGFLVIETGESGSMNRLLTEIDGLLKSSIERLERQISEGIDQGLAIMQSGGDKSKLN
jgi:hypothetical protein